MGEFRGVEAARRRSEKDALHSKHPAGLRDGDRRIGEMIGEMVEHVDGHDGVERCGPQRQCSGVGLHDWRMRPGSWPVSIPASNSYRLP